MARPYDPHAKTHDPAWIAARNRQDRHKLGTQISLRIPSETRDHWRTQAQAKGLTLKDWIIQRCNA